jgi:hypothetical protein
MTRLPTPGSDDGTWGNVLNDFLGVEHAIDGVLKIRTDGTLANFYTKPSGGIPATDMTSGVQTQLNAAGKTTIAKSGTTIGTRGILNLIPGANTTITTVDDSGNNRVNITIAASDVLNAADYGATFDGSTDDSTALQAAITAAATAKKPLILPPGTAMIGTSLNVTSAVSVLGSDRENTVLKAVNGLNDYVIKFSGGSAGVGIVSAHFSGFTIDGNSANQTAGGGISADGAVQCTFERLHLTSNYNWGLKLGPITGGAFGHHNRVINCLFDNSGSSAGFGGGAWTTSSDENWFLACDFEFLGGSSNPVDNNPVMLYDQAGLEYVVDCNFVGGYHNCIGVRVQNTKDTKIIGCTFDGVAGDAVYIVATKCLIASNTFTGIGDNGVAGVSSVHTQYGAAYCIISNNVFESSVNVANLRSHVREEQIGNSGPNLIEGNTFVTATYAPTTAAVESAGLGTVVRNNLGFVTDNLGTSVIASGSTTIVVTHGLGMTPTLANIAVTPTNNLGTATKFWISNATATQFTINVNADPGATTATFSWAAKL